MSPHYKSMEHYMSKIHNTQKSISAVLIRETVSERPELCFRKSNPVFSLYL